MRLLRNLSIGRKLALIVAVMGVPILVLIYLYVGARDAQIEIVRQELAGHEALRRLRDVTATLPLYRAAAESAPPVGLEDAAARVDAALARVDADDARMRADPRWVRFRTDWNDLSQHVASLSPEEAHELHAALAAGLNALLLRVGEDSKLSMDPDIDEHFLASAAVEDLPARRASLANLRSLTQRRRRSAGEQERLRQAVVRLTTELDQALIELEHGLDAMGARSPALSQGLTQPLERTRATLNTVIDRARARTTDLRSTLAAVDDARQASLELHDATLAALGQQLTGRLDRLVREKALQLLLVIFVLALAVLLVMYSNRSITGQIREINRLFGRISVGDLQARARVTSPDGSAA